MQPSDDERSSSEGSEGWETVNFNSTKSKHVTETIKKLEAALSPTDDSDSSEDEERSNSVLSDLSLDLDDADTDYYNTLPHEGSINVAANTLQPEECSTLNNKNHPIYSVSPDFQSDKNANSNMFHRSSQSNISSPEEEADNESEHIGDEHDVIPRMNNLQYTYVESKAHLYCEDLTSDDEVWLIECPTTMKVESLVGQPIVFGGTSKIPVVNENGNHTTFEMVTSSKMRRTLNCILPSRRRKGYEAVNLDVMGHLRIREKLRTLHVEIPPVRLSTVAFPTDLKVRHPLFGPDYQNEINVAKTTPKRKKGGSSSRRPVKMERDPPPESAGTVRPVKLKLRKVGDLLADANEDQHKKAKKRGHDSDSEPEVKKKKRKHDQVVWEQSSSESELQVKKKKKKKKKKEKEGLEGIWAPFSSSCLKVPPNLSQSLPVQDPEQPSPHFETRSGEKPRRKHKEGKRLKLEKE